jgi:dsRNA-specific ribonuclease
MNSFILEYLREIFGIELDNPDLQIALTQDKNKRLALIGDSVLNLVVKLREYEKPNTTAGTIDKARQLLANKKILQKILNQDKSFTEFLKKEYGCTSPVGKIGLERADDFMEAIIGTIFLTKGFEMSQRYVNQILKHRTI